MAFNKDYYIINSRIGVETLDCMKKQTKILLIAGIAVDVAITIFLFIISIIMLVKLGKYGDTRNAIANTDPNSLFYFLLNNTNVYFWAFVFPLFVLLAGNIVGLVIYVKKTSVKEAPTKLEDLSEDQKALLMQEMMKEFQKPAGEKAEETPAPAEENKGE